MSDNLPESEHGVTVLPPAPGSEALTNVYGLYWEGKEIVALGYHFKGCRFKNCEFVLGGDFLFTDCVIDGELIISTAPPGGTYWLHNLRGFK